MMWMPGHLFMAKVKISWISNNLKCWFVYLQVSFKQNDVGFKQVITNSSAACRWMLHLWILRCLHLQEGNAHRHFGLYPSMSIVHAEAPHHSEVQTTAGPAAGITVQTRQYIHNAFIQHPKRNSCNTSQMVLLTFMFPSNNPKTKNRGPSNRVKQIVGL